MIDAAQTAPTVAGRIEVANALRARAVHFDEAKELERAFELYMEASHQYLKILLDLGGERNESHRDAISLKITECTERGSEIMTLLERQREEAAAERPVITSTLERMCESGTHANAAAAASSSTHDADRFEARMRSAADLRISFETIEGMDEMKTTLRDAVMTSMDMPHIYAGEDSPRKPIKALLLYGLPGNGKTMFAEATAKALGWWFLSVNSEDIVTSLVGSTEKNIAALTKTILGREGTVVFFDEFDALGGERKSTDQKHDTLMVNRFLTFFDAVKTKAKDFLLVAATNRPDGLDSGMVRRFDKILMVGLPDLAAKRAIFKKRLGRYGVDHVLTDEDLDRVAADPRLEKFTGSDVVRLVSDVLQPPVREMNVAGAFRRDETTEKYVADLDPPPCDFCDTECDGEECERCGYRRCGLATLKTLISKEEIFVRAVTMEDVERAIGQSRSSVVREDEERLLAWSLSRPKV